MASPSGSVPVPRLPDATLVQEASNLERIQRQLADGDRFVVVPAVPEKVTTELRFGSQRVLADVTSPEGVARLRSLSPPIVVDGPMFLQGWLARVEVARDRVAGLSLHAGGEVPSTTSPSPSSGGRAELPTYHVYSPPHAENVFLTLQDVIDDKSELVAAMQVGRGQRQMSWRSTPLVKAEQLLGNVLARPGQRWRARHPASSPATYFLPWMGIGREKELSPSLSDIMKTGRFGAKIVRAASAFLWRAGCLAFGTGLVAVGGIVAAAAISTGGAPFLTWVVAAVSTGAGFAVGRKPWSALRCLATDAVVPVLMNGGQRVVERDQDQRIRDLARTVEQAYRVGSDIGPEYQVRLKPGENLETAVEQRRVQLIDKIVDDNSGLFDALLTGAMRQYRGGQLPLSQVDAEPVRRTLAGALFLSGSPQESFSDLLTGLQRNSGALSVDVGPEESFELVISEEGIASLQASMKDARMMISRGASLETRSP